MTPPYGSERLIVFERDGNYSRPSHVTITESTEGSLPLQPEELIQGAELDYDKDLAGIANNESAETKLEPLSAEMIFSDFRHVVSIDTGDRLLETVPGTPEYQTAFKAAKDEIVLKHLWRMGLPSELATFLDIDEQDTRQLLQEEYAKIPEDTKRDNSANSFRNRWDRFMGHFAERDMPEDDIRDVIEIWRADLQIRREVTHEDYEEPTQTEIRRQEFLEAYLDDSSEGTSEFMLRMNIGNTLLCATQTEIERFTGELDSSKPNSLHSRQKIERLRSFVVEHFVKEETQ